MASTWSALKVELLETGGNPGQWGNLTNVNLGDAVLGEAITGQATVDFATDADVTITLTDAATTQAARNLRLNITESSSGVGSVRNLILGSGCQIEKFYLINNTGTGAKTVKNTSGTGISVPAGKATLVFNNGTNVVDAASYFTSLTLGSALPVTSGGTGVTTSTGSGNNVLSTSPVLTTPNLGTPTTLVLSSATGLPLSSGVTGILPVANGGTATATPSLVQGSNITITGTWPNQTIAAAAPGTGTVTSVSGTGTVNGLSLSGSVTTSGSLTLGGTLSSVANSALTNSSVTVTAGTGMSGGGAVALGSSVTLTNAGVTSLVAGANITLSGATGAVTVSASGGAAPAMVLVASATASSSAAVVFNNLSTTYRAYLVEYDQVQLATNSQNLLMQISTDNGSSYISSNYKRVGLYMTTGTVQGNVETAASFLYIGAIGGWSNLSSRRGAGQVMMFAPNTGGSPQLFTHTSVTTNNGGDNEITQMVMQNSSTSAVNAIQFFSSSGNIAAGNFRLYGLVNA